MTVVRCIIVATVLVLFGGGPVQADTGAGVSTPQPPPIVQPPPTNEPPPIVSAPTDIPIPVATEAPPVQPVPDTSPVVVRGERPSHLVATIQPTVTLPSSGPTGPSPAPTAVTPSSSISSTTQPAPSTGTTPPMGYTADTGNSTESIASLGSSTGNPDASAPEQLSCGKKQYPTAEPFLISPFGGWATINSFVDHDYPDYAMDGRMVLANGLVASASQGEESDFFPAYWSTSLRQYVNYDGHNGYDFGISYQRVLAAAGGTVAYAGWNGASESEGYGQMILINHHNGYVTLYGHLSTLEVHKGDQVTAGEEIGISGSTGNSSGPHLHFSVFHNCNVTDPYGWTGSGADPLKSFNGETAAYLWLPGHDPLILNPPPGWPTFPAGLHLKLPALSTRSRSLPPVDRLLLLTLPDPSPSAGLTAGPALARTESAITQEGELLVPYLDDLRAQGLISGYQIIPAAAAVWVRGTADSATLEALPGVASLSGVSPDDLTAAQTGLAHSVLIQLGKQQAPSLWPVGFRSALHAWRPLVTAVNGHALVAGYALPGQNVTVSVNRQGRAPGAAQTTSDPQTGGFVVMLHNSNGDPVAVRAGDVVEVRSGGRQASVTVAAFSMHAHARSLSGRTRPGSSVPITVIPAGGGPVQQIISSTDTTGRFHVSLPEPLGAGALAIASTVDAGGDQESAAGYVPGMVVDLAGSSVTGWIAGHGSTLQVWRHGREVYSRSLSPAPDGSFRVALVRAGNPVPLSPGDDVSIGTQWHRYRAAVPRLALTLSSGASSLEVTGPPHATVNVRWNRPANPWQRALATGVSGHASLSIPGPKIGIGDSATAEVQSPNGSGFVTSQRVRGIIVHEHSNRVTGQTIRGSAIRIRAVSGKGKVLATARLTSDPLTGAFSTHLLDSHNRRVHIEPGMVVQIGDASGNISVRVPQLQLTVLRPKHELQIDAPGTRGATLTWTVAGGRVDQRRVRLSADGLARTSLVSTSRKATVAVVGAGSVLFERSVRTSVPCTSCAAGGRR